MDRRRGAASARTLGAVLPDVVPAPDAERPADGAHFRWYEVVVRGADGAEVAWAQVARRADEATVALLGRLGRGAGAALLRVADRGAVAQCPRHPEEQVLWTVPGGPGHAQPAPFRVHRCRACLPGDRRCADALPLHPEAQGPPGDALPCPFCGCEAHVDRACCAPAAGGPCACGPYSADVAAALFAEDARGRALTSAAGSDRVGP